MSIRMSNGPNCGNKKCSYPPDHAGPHDWEFLPLAGIEPDPIIRLAGALAEIDIAAIKLQDAVNAARAAGLSWATIGGVLGVSRQSAYERFTK